MEKRELGRTGLMVTPLGFGAAELGFRNVSQEQSQRVLNGALDAGINVIDTAACYVDSEEKIGRSIGGRRDEYVLITKCGHQAGLEAPEWSAKLIGQSVDRSLQRLRTDRVDVLLLHSCDAEQLRDDDMLAALLAVKQAGKARFIGYSGDRDRAERAVQMDLFDCLETSVSLCDQQVLDTYLPAARKRQIGVIAKRPVANACWKDLRDDPTYHEYAKPYTERLAKMGFTPESLGFDGAWIELALRFTVHQPGVNTAIVGSTDTKHLAENVRLVGKGNLPDTVANAIRNAWHQNADETWTGQT